MEYGEKYLQQGSLLVSGLCHSSLKENPSLDTTKVSYPAQLLEPSAVLALLPQLQSRPQCWHPAMHHMAIRQRCHLPTLIRPTLHGAPSQENKQRVLQGTAGPESTAPLADPHCVSLHFAVNSATRTELFIFWCSWKDTNLVFGICVRIRSTAADCCSRADLPIPSPTYAL